MNSLWRKKYIDTDQLTQSQLSRCLTIKDLTGLGIGSTLGAGIYVVAAEVARSLAGPSVVISFLIAAIASVFSGLCYAEFGARVPKAGSAYVYSYVTIGELCSFIIGWNLILEYVIGASSVARAWSSYFDSILDDEIRNFTITNIGEIHVPGLGKYPDFFALVVVCVIVIILSFGVKNSSRFNNVVTWVNLFVILFISIVGFYFAKKENWTKDFMPFGFSGVLSGAATCFYAFVGFDVIATTGEEAKNPSKSIPIAIVLSLGICFVAYFGVSAALTLMWPYNLLPERGALPKVFALRGAPWAQYVIAVGALCGLTASLIGGLFPLPRLLYAMASDGLLFKCLAYIHPKTEVPVIATIISGLLAAFLALIFELQELVEMMSIGTLLAYTVVAACVLLLRYKPGSIGVTMNVLSDLNMVPAATTDERRKLLAESSNASAPTEETYRKAAICVAVESLLFIFACSLAIWGDRALLTHQGWAVFLACLIGILILVTALYLIRQPKNETLLPFMVPLVPWIPLLSIFINIFLMLKLSYLTWIRFAVWMVIGMCIYFFYGLHHSVEGERQKEQGNYIPLEQVDTEDPKENPEEPSDKDDEEDKPKEEGTEDKKDEKSTP